MSVQVPWTVDVLHLDITCPYCHHPLFVALGRAPDAPDLQARAFQVGAQALNLHARHGCPATRRPR